LFTGIIEELGTVQKLDLLKDSARLTLKADKVLENTQIGDSIAVNGVCLTVTKLSSGLFAVDIMHETLTRTNLQQLKQNSQVNLERALQLQTRLGGHLVSGHIDGTGRILGIQEAGIAKVYKIAADSFITNHSVAKGSIAIDGISLTLIDVEDGYFTVSLIPHTAMHTTLGFKYPGDTVNIETDIIGKYVAKLLNPRPEAKKDISLEFLTENGFI
jgi:riboflavin synthase